MKKRGLSLLLALAMCLSLFPMATQAADKVYMVEQGGVTIMLDGVTEKAHKVVDYVQQETVGDEVQDKYYYWDFEVYKVAEPTVLTITWEEGVEMTPESVSSILHVYGEYKEDCYVAWGVDHVGDITEEDLANRKIVLELDLDDLFWESDVLDISDNSFAIFYAGPVSVFLTRDGVIGRDYAEPDATAYASTQTVSIDGKAVELQAYALKDADGNPTNYVKLRDVAYVLNGTAAQFEVGWDGDVNILTGQSYTANGSEMSTPFSGDRAYTVPEGVTKINGEAKDLAAITLTDDSGGGYTYYQLRDLGRALGFNVGWSAERGIFIETDKPYTDAD